jgi:hypothetical protein
VSQGEQGGPVVNQAGAVIGLAAGARAAVPADRLRQSLESARRNLAAGRLTALRTVAANEHHLYGAVRIQSSIANATARVSPLENWQWSETAAAGAVPFTFAGPMGRYRLQLQAEGGVSHQAEFQIDPGVLKEVNEPQIVARGGGKFPWPIALLGAAGAAVAGVFILTSGGNEPVTTDKGSVVVILPQRR